MGTMGSTNTVAYVCRYHVAFCPKHQRKALVPPINERLKTILAEQTERWEQDLIELEVVPDHVHLLVRGDPQFGIHRLIQVLKGYSSQALREELPSLKR